MGIADAMKMGWVMVGYAVLLASGAMASSFWDNFFVTYGGENIRFLGRPRGSVVQLGLSNKTGSGFQSKVPYLFGEISMRIKLPAGDSAGTVTSFYMASKFKNWSELDLEFLGNVSGQPYILQTNVFVEGIGNREQRIYLWFNPRSHYHTYGFRWNNDITLFLVDNIVIRMFRNNKDVGVPYLDYQPMYIYSSLWNGDSWATRGGLVKTNWTNAPFTASYTGFNVDNACAVTGEGATATDVCYRKLYQSSYGSPYSRKITSRQRANLRSIRSKYLIYDYCSDTKRFTTTPPECRTNWP